MYKVLWTYSGTIAKENATRYISRLKIACRPVNKKADRSFRLGTDGLVSIFYTIGCFMVLSQAGYLSSCSKLWKISQLKKLKVVILNPSHNSLIVDIVVLFFLSLTILVIIDCAAPLIAPNLFTVMFFSLQSSKIRSFTADLILTIPPSNSNELA